MRFDVLLFIVSPVSAWPWWIPCWPHHGEPHQPDRPPWEPPHEHPPYEPPSHHHPPHHPPHRPPYEPPHRPPFEPPYEPPHGHPPWEPPCPPPGPPDGPPDERPPWERPPHGPPGDRPPWHPPHPHPPPFEPPPDEPPPFEPPPDEPPPHRPPFRPPPEEPPTEPPPPEKPLPPREKPGQTYNLTLPWGIWQSQYDNKTEIYKFANVRFGAPPLGSLRFNASIFPDWSNKSVQVGSNASCHQITNPRGSPCAAGGNAPITPENGTVFQSEDCLFLDVYVPADVMENIYRQPPSAAVAVWIYGGAFLFGSKNYMTNDTFNTPFYDGTGIVERSNGNTIVVAGNYRVGAFGWLAGKTMETYGYPNAGLSDQRLLFDWVYSFIGQVGGDKGSISAWGESAGASSILHHLISRDGNSAYRPRFKRAALQSPAFQWLWNSTGFLEQTFINFTCAVCAINATKECCPTNKITTKPVYSVANLTTLDASILVQANQRLFQETASCNGLFPVGPSVDGRVLQHLAPVEFANGRFAPLESLILSHVAEEAATFIDPPFAKDEAEFEEVVESIFSGPALGPVRSDIYFSYAPWKYDNNQTLRLKAVIQDFAFLSNNRILFDTYSEAGTPVYAMVWDALNLTRFNSTFSDYSYHGTDVPALFYNNHWNFTGFVRHYNPKLNVTDEEIGLLLKIFNTTITSPYQRRWNAHAQTGNPNFRGELVKWKEGFGTQGAIENALIVAPHRLTIFPFWHSGPDVSLPASLADFWIDQAQTINSLTKLTAGSNKISDTRPDQVPMGKYQYL